MWIHFCLFDYYYENGKDCYRKPMPQPILLNVVDDIWNRIWGLMLFNQVFYCVFFELLTICYCICRFFFVIGIYRSKPQSAYILPFFSIKSWNFIKKYKSLYFSPCKEKKIDLADKWIRLVDWFDYELHCPINGR